MPAEKSSSDHAFPAVGTAVTAPSHLAHIVLFANDMGRMRDFWVKLLGARVQFEAADAITLLSYDEEHHRIGLLNRNRPGVVPGESTFAHVAFTYPTLRELMQSYRQRRDLHGIRPVWCVNHGPTTSMYYKDPEGNTAEMQYDNFDTTAAADDYLRSDAFRQNPVGADFDPEDLIARLEAGTPVEELVVRRDVGPRTIDSVPM